MKKPRVTRRFDTGWMPVQGQGEPISYDMKFYRTDTQTGKDISNDEIHGVQDERAQNGEVCLRVG